jgi:hypothetical protein
MLKKQYTLFQRSDGSPSKEKRKSIAAKKSAAAEKAKLLLQKTNLPIKKKTKYNSNLKSLKRRKRDGDDHIMEESIDEPEVLK